MPYRKPVHQHKLKVGKFSVRVTGTKPIPLGKMDKRTFLQLANNMRKRASICARGRGAGTL